MTLQLTGIHHLTAITADAPGNLRFYTQALGMRLAVPVSRVQLADPPAGQEGPSSVAGMPIPQNA